MDLLLVIDGIKLRYAYIKDFDRFTFHKTKNKNKRYVCKSCLQCFSSKNVLKEYKRVCLSINGTQSVELEKGTIEFKNYFKQILVPSKVYPDFECNLKSAEIFEGFYSKNYHDHVPCNFAYTLFCVDVQFTKPTAVFRSENAAYKFIKSVLKEYLYCKKLIKKHFHKSLIMSEEEEQVQLSNTCWICEKLIYDDDKKVRVHCHLPGKFKEIALFVGFISCML